MRQFSLGRVHMRPSTAVLAALLILEVALTVLMRTLGWFGTGNALQLVACVLVTIAPLLIAVGMLAASRFRFGVRSLMFVVVLVGAFLTLSLVPLLEYRSTRKASSQLIVAKATVNAGLDWDDFYKRIDLPPPPIAATSKVTSIPPCLTPFTKNLSNIPSDDAVRSLWLNSDAQIEILADNWERFSSLQSVSISRGVAKDALELLGDTLPWLKQLHSVQTNDVRVPKHWYRSLTNVRALWVWGEGSSLGKPFPNEELVDIASLPNLEVLMVFGYAFDDSDARTLSTSRSIKRIVFRHTAVTQIGEAELADKALGRIVYRD
jgi:hypothetical protein